jgi:hypothetical protein
MGARGVETYVVHSPSMSSSSISTPTSGGFHLTLGVANHFIWHWASLGSYSNVVSYCILFVGQTALLGAKELWKVRALNTYRFFVWLVLHGHC